MFSGPKPPSFLGVLILGVGREGWDLRMAGAAGSLLCDKGLGVIRAGEGGAGGER